MKKIIFVAILFSSIFASANLVNSAWTGKTNLFINDKLHCSDDSSDKAPVLNPADGYFTLHKGGKNLIWAYIGSGCAMGWNNEYMPFQVVENKLTDESGNIVGNISKLSIEAKNFYSERKKFFIESLVINTNDLEKLTVTMSYTQAASPKKYKFIGIYTRHHDSVWP